MSKMLKKVGVITVACALLITSFAGCGKTAVDSPSSSTTASSSTDSGSTTPKEKVDIKAWVRGSGPDAGYNAIIDKFNSENEDINMAYEYYGENYATVVQMALAAGNPPDILEGSGGITVSTLAKQGQVVPLDDILTDDLLKGLHPDAIQPKEFYYDGKIYSVPIRISTYRLLYNKDLFTKAGLDPEQPPKTLEEMRDMAKKITEAGNGDFFGFGLPLGVGQIWERVIDPINMAMGVGDRYGFNTKTGKYEFESNKKMFNYYVDLMKDGSLFPGYLTLGIDPLRANFSQGKVGMYIDGSWMVANYAVQMKTTSNWDCAPLPVFEGTTAGKYWAEGSVTWMVTKGQHEAEAKKFYISWLQNQTLANQVMPVPRTDLAANEISNLPTDQFDLKGMKYSFDTSDLQIPVFEPHKFITLEGDDRNKVLTNMFAKAAGSKDISAELDAALADLNNRYTAALDKAIADGVVDANDVKATGN